MEKTIEDTLGGGTVGEWSYQRGPKMSALVVDTWVISSSSVMLLTSPMNIHNCY